MTTVTMTRDEIIAELDRESQRRLSMPAKNLFRLYREGELDDPGSVADLLILADLLPEDDALFAAA